MKTWANSNQNKFSSSENNLKNSQYKLNAKLQRYNFGSLPIIIYRSRCRDSIKVFKKTVSVLQNLVLALMLLAAAIVQRYTKYIKVHNWHISFSFLTFTSSLEAAIFIYGLNPFLSDVKSNSNSKWRIFLRLFYSLFSLFLLLISPFFFVLSLKSLLKRSINKFLKVEVHFL